MKMRSWILVIVLTNTYIKTWGNLSMDLHRTSKDIRQLFCMSINLSFFSIILLVAVIFFQISVLLVQQDYSWKDSPQDWSLYYYCDSTDTPQWEKAAQWIGKYGGYILYFRISLFQSNFFYVLGNVYLFYVNFFRHWNDFYFLNRMRTWSL